MLIELTRLIGQPVRVNENTVIGKVDLAIIDGANNRVRGFQVVQGGILRKFRGLLVEDIESFSDDGISINSLEKLQSTLTPFDEQFQKYGSLLDVKAKTETGKSLGRVTDALIDFDTGYMGRIHVRNLLREQIIPIKFLVSVTPREVVFKDVVSQPIFNKVAAAEA